MNEKPEALRLADECDWSAKFKAAKELRRLHAENEVLTAKIKAREDEILTHSEAVYEATKLLSEEREKNERLREALAWAYNLRHLRGHSDPVVIPERFAPLIEAALRREET